MSGKGHKEGLEQRKSHNSVADEVPLKAKEIYIGKMAAETSSFWMPCCFDGFRNCSETFFFPCEFILQCGKGASKYDRIPLWACCWICLTAATPDCSREKGKKPHVK